MFYCVLFLFFVLLAESCANSNNLFSKAELAKKCANNIVNVTYDVTGGGQLEKKCL